MNNFNPHTNPRPKGARRPKLGPAVPPMTVRQQGVGAALRSPSFEGQYAWHYLTDEQKAAYATWKESSGSGEQSILTEGGALPKNWLLLDKGSIPGVADRDVGSVGIEFTLAAMAHMQSGGTSASWRAWAQDIGSRVAQGATVT